MFLKSQKLEFFKKLNTFSDMKLYVGIKTSWLWNNVENSTKKSMPSCVYRMTTKIKHQYKEKHKET